MEAHRHDSAPVRLGGPGRQLFMGLRDLLAGMPGHALFESLRQARGKGRDDYPVSVLWGTLVLSIALRHASLEACLGEFSRNITGAWRFHAHLGAVIVMHAGFATALASAPRREPATLGRMRLTAVAEALRANTTIGHDGTKT